MSRGGFKFDEIKAEDGTKIPIKLDKDSGVFSIEVSKGERIQGTELDDVKRRALAWLAENRALDWKPRIAIAFEGRSGWRAGHSISLEYARGFVAVDARGSGTAAAWDEIAETDEERELNKLDTLRGKPGRRDSDWKFRAGENRVVLEYTPERWSALRLITRAIESIEEKLQAFLSEEKAAATLAAIAQAGVANLLAGPKKEGK